MNIEPETIEREESEEIRDKIQKTPQINWWLFLLNCTFAASGTVGGSILIRLYYQHGGTRKWIPTWLLSSGFPVFIFPLIFFYCKTHFKPHEFFLGRKLILSSAFIGLLVGLDNFGYSLGLSYTPLSTNSILLSTQLAFTTVFALILVKQRLTPFSINSVVLMSLGSVILGLRKSSDRPEGVTDGEYLLGFFVTLGAAALFGLVLTLVELAYAKGGKIITYTIMYQFQLSVSFWATVFSTVGMLVNRDFMAMTREAKDYEIGETNYYMVLVWCAICWQLSTIGTLGLIFCSSAFLCSIVLSLLLPVTEVAAVIIFKEKFTAEKGVSLFMCLWGFISYFYGAYKMDKKPPSRS